MTLDPSSWPGSGGGSSLVTEAGYYSGTQVAAGNRPPWDILDAGTDVLDRTNPIEPVARKAGLFNVSAEVTVEAAIAFCLTSLIFDYGNDNAVVETEAGPDGSGRTTLLVSGSYVLAAGEKIRLLVTTDGAATTLELANATVSRVGPA